VTTPLLAGGFLPRTQDLYLSGLVARFNRPLLLPALEGAYSDLASELRAWGGSSFRQVSPSGSWAKGTAVPGQTDLDIFVSLKSEPDALPLREVYLRLVNRMRQLGVFRRQQDVSVGVVHRGLSIDITVGREHPSAGGYHSIYRSRADTWTQTNIDLHVGQVRASGLQDEIRLVKRWRTLKNLEIPSFLVELAVLDALQGRRSGSLHQNLTAVFRYLAVDFGRARLTDPANTNNIVSDDVPDAYKTIISAHAVRAITAKRWSDVVA
jgi:hypothetical protein